MCSVEILFWLEYGTVLLLIAGRVWSCIHACLTRARSICFGINDWFLKLISSKYWKSMISSRVFKTCLFKFLIIQNFHCAINPLILDVKRGKTRWVERRHSFWLRQFQLASVGLVLIFVIWVALHCDARSGFSEKRLLDKTFMEEPMLFSRRGV